MIRFFLISALVALAGGLLLPSVSARVLFDNEFTFDSPVDNLFIIDSLDDGSGDITLQFGNDPTPANNADILWDISETDFVFDEQVDIDQNQFIRPVWENLASDPPSPVAGQIYTNTVDGNTYVYNGTIWEDITAISATASKVISVGTGLDFASIETGAGYLNTLSGGIMLLSAEVLPVSNAVDLTNIILIGKDPTKTTVQIADAGQFDTFDTTFMNLTIEVLSIDDDMALDVQTGTSSLLFDFVDFSVLDSGDSLIDSNAVGAPTLTLKIVQSNTLGGSGSILKSQGSGNINGASSIIVAGASGNGLLRLEDWDLTIAGSGNVLTSGVISTVPSDTIFVYPGMNLQGAIDSLTGGGSITLLPGTHSISSPLNITTDSIDIAGYGDDSVISASGFTGTTATTAAIQLGAANGTAPVNDVTLRDFRLEVSGATGVDDIHGVRTAGGADLELNNVTVVKIAGESGTAGTARMGIHFIDGTSEVLDRPVIINCRVLGNGGTNYFTDGIHVTSDPTIGGVFGNNTGVDDPLVEGNYVDYVRETAYVFVGVQGGSLYNNRSTRMGAAGGGAYGIYIGNVSNVRMDANVFSGSLSTASVAIGIESFNTGSLKETLDSVFSNNIIDGDGNGGVGFNTGFQIGSASANTAVLRNVFQNNTISGASVAAGSTAIIARTDADDNLFEDNDISGGINNWVNGINISSALAARNTLRSNRFDSVTNLILDSGTSTLIEGTVYLESVNPTVNEDIDSRYRVGDFWINTASDTAFVLVDSSSGAAVWNTLESSGGEILDQMYDNDAGERTITVDDGDVSFDTATSQSYIIDLQASGDVIFQDGGTPFATFTDAGNVDFVNNLTVGGASETIADVSFSLDGDDVFVADSLGVEGAVYTDSTAEKFFFMDIAGGVRTSLANGTVGGGQSTVLRYDATNDSISRWSFPVPDDWESGTDILLDFFWSPADASAGNVVFDFDYAGWAVGETITGGGFTNLSSTEATPASQLQVSIVTFTMAAANLAADDMINFALSRDPTVGGDTYGDDANVHKIRVRYTGKKIL